MAYNQVLHTALLLLRNYTQIKEAEVDSVADLGAFVDAELKYYDRCRDVLLQLKQNWPAGQVPSLSVIILFH